MPEENRAYRWGERGSGTGQDSEGKPREVGDIEASVLSDIEVLGEAASRPGKRTLAAMAIKLARSLDVRGDEESPSQTAKAVDTLRITMGQLMQGDDHDPELRRQLEELLGTPTTGGSAVSAPVRYPARSQPADPRPGGGPDSSSAG